MSQICPSEYRHQVCPFCRSKKIQSVHMQEMGGGYYYTIPATGGVATITRNGFLCDNCQRYHPIRNAKFRVDRAEMRRDIKKLQEYLLENVK